MKVLTFTTLFPNGAQPRHGIFVAERLRHLRKTCPDLEHKVVAPVPWFPSRAGIFGGYALLASVPAQEVRDGVEVMHPRYPVIPKVGMDIAPVLMAARMLPWTKRLRTRYPYELIDAHFLYPDGIAAVALGKRLGVPVVVTARGNDLSLYPRWAIPRRWLRWCLREADAVVTVCQALADRAVELEPSCRPKVLRNGVDIQKFRPVEREKERAAFGMSRFTLVSVGHLIERKGHHFVIEALRELPDVGLVIAGDGPWESRLRSLADRCGVAGRVRFLGHVDHDRLPSLYSAADALVLASSREGLANVLLEAMACGTPVVATAVWGTPEVVAAPEAGVLVPERSAAGIAEGIRRLRENLPDRGATRRYAEQFSWDETSRGQYELFRESLASGVRSRISV